MTTTSRAAASWLMNTLGRTILLVIPGFALVLFPLPSRADVTVAPLFRDHGVLQRDRDVTIWGWASPAEEVVVTFAGQRVKTSAQPTGRWEVTLAPLATARAGTDLVIQGRNTLVIRDVLVGDVWLCSGQSNMVFSLSAAQGAAAAIADGENSQIRHFRVTPRTTDIPQDNAEGGWLAASPATVGGFTAVGYFFARDVEAKLKVPIGLVHASYGGTLIQAWLAKDRLASEPALAVYLERWAKGLSEYPAKKASYDERLSRWQVKSEQANRAGESALAEFQRENPKPTGPWPSPGEKSAPSGAYNAMIHPLLPYTIRGVLWYQGESNAKAHADYLRQFSALIEDWRQRFHHERLPFLWVQLPNFKSGNAAAREWAFLREAQAKALALPATGMAISIDVGDPENIHPARKEEVGHRLALIALAKVYGVPVEDQGPVFVGILREGRSLRVAFDLVNGGLIVRGEKVLGLELAGADRKFFAAEAILNGSDLVISSPEVQEPVAVRYAWTNSPEANLYNRAGLPVAPFRSDSW